jgi:hypothetical protein
MPATRIGMNGAAVDVGDFEVAALVWQLNRGQILALFLEYLDAGIETVVVEGVVGNLFEIQINGGGSRGLGVLRHGKFFLGGLLNLGMEQDRKDDVENQGRVANPDVHRKDILLPAMC